MERPKLGELLLRVGAIDETRLQAALAEQRKRGSPLGMTIVRMGFLDEETLVRTLARQLKLPLAWLRGRRVRPEVLALVPVELAEKHRCLPLAASREGGEQVLFLAMQDPADLAAQGEVCFRTGCQIKPVLVAPGELEDALRRHYPGARPGAAAELVELDEPVAPEPAGEPDFLFLEREVRFAPRADGRALELLRAPERSNRDTLLQALVALAEALVAKGEIERGELVEALGGRARG